MTQNNQKIDLFLQVIFVAALVVIAVSFYLTRVVDLRADDGKKDLNIDDSNISAYQIEQQEKQLNSRIKTMQADYAAAVTDYQLSKQKLGEMSLNELDKREKMAELETIYNQDFFEKKLESLNAERQKLLNLQKLKCQKFCTFEDLSSSL